MGLKLINGHFGIHHNLEIFGICLKSIEFCAAYQNFWSSLTNHL